MLLLVNNADFYRVADGMLEIILVIHRCDDFDACELFPTATKLTKEQAKERLISGVTVQFHPNTLVPVIGEAITGSNNATD